MIELDGPIIPVDLPCFTEAPWIHKRGDWYYLSYASEFPEKICYAMSRSITGPWEYKGILNELAGNSNTNHQAIIEFKGILSIIMVALILQEEVFAVRSV
jgi:beta-xylosidase